MARRSSSAPPWSGRLLLGCAMAGWVVTVFVVVVVGGGFLIGQLDRPSLPLSLLATAVAALGYERVRTALSRRVGRSPYERLARFSATVAHSIDTSEVAPELARRVGEATGAVGVEVWLHEDRHGSEATLVARWPRGPAATREDTVRHRYPIRHLEQILGWLVVQQRLRRPLEPIEQRLVGDLCAQAGLALRHVQLTEDLRRSVAESEKRAEELRSSRQRVVAAADAERQRLERDIHDGAQQHLIALVINLALARGLLAEDPARLAALAPALGTAVHEALAVLDDLGRGIYPRQLLDEGIAAALRGATASSAVPVQIEDHTPGRYRPETEAAAYFACLEAVQNAIKHSRGSHICVTLSGEADGLDFEVVDNGQGFDVHAAGAGAGTLNLRDRLDAVHGHAVLVSDAGRGTQVRGRLPVSPAASAAVVP